MDQNIAILVLPAIVLFGGALIGATILSLFGVYFVSKKLTIIGFCLGVFLLGVSELAFVATGAFFNNQKIVVSECEFEAERAYPDKKYSKGNEIGRYIRSCLDKQDFDFVDDNVFCHDAPIETNPYCYLPRGAFDRFVSRAQMKIGS